MTKLFITLITIVTALMPASASADVTLGDGNRSDEGYKQISPELVFLNTKYSDYEDKLEISFDMRKRRDISSFSGIFFSIESNDREVRNMLVDWESESSIMDIFVISDGEVHKHSMHAPAELSESAPINVAMNLDFRKDMLELRIRDHVIFFHDLNLNINKEYRFTLLPKLSEKTEPNIQPVLAVDNVRVMATEVPAKKTVWYWFGVIIVADIIIYLIVWLRRSKWFRGKTKPVLVLGDSFVPESLPVVKSILLFGGLYIYGASGENITRKFSPMLRELLSLIVLHSAGNGISSAKLKELLWPDKDIASARNNRAVYLGKLRAQLDTIGEYSLSNKTGDWKFEPEDIFVDYLQFAGIDWTSDSPPRDQIEKLLAVIQAGNLMPEADYRWLDKFKAETADLVIDKLWSFSKTLQIEKSADFTIVIADSIFRFDHLNEQALYLKCKAYQLSGRHSLAKKTFDIFRDEYREVYERPLTFSFTELLDKDPSEFNG